MPDLLCCIVGLASNFQHSGVSFRSDDVVTSPQGTIQQITERTGDRRYPFYDNSGRTMPAQASWVFEYYGIEGVDAS